MSTWESYFLAGSITDALHALENSPGDALPVAGGTDFLLDLQQGRHAPVHTLVDLSRIPELLPIEERRRQLFIGAGVPLNQVIASPLVQEHAQALYDAVSLIGGPQVRNSATLGGNVAHALPAADGTIALLALDGQAEIAKSHDRCLLPVEDLFRGPGITALDLSKEILVGFYLPLRAKAQGSAFRRVMRPQGVAIAILNMAIWLERDGERIKDARISIGPAGPKPLRARSSEAALRGKQMDDQALNVALQALLSDARFRTSPHRATEEYRRHLAGVLLRETVEAAWQRSF
jgi:carbon-monoxide dehydrogenase medium subunit